MVLKIVFLSVSIATKVTISKIYHLIRLRFEQSEHKKSQCEYGIRKHGNVSMKKMITKGLMSFVRACKHALVKIRDRVQTETLIFPIQIWSTFSDKKI